MDKKIKIIFLILFFCFKSSFCQDTTYLGNLGTIVITPLRFPESMQELPTNVDVIEKKEILEIQAETAGDAIQRLCGMNIIKEGATGCQISPRLRGLPSGNVLIMVDGRPINDVSLGVGNLSEIPVEIIERIEILRGPVSSLYGANALGGVINIITSCKGDKFSLETGQFGLNSFRLISDLRNSGIFLAGSYLKTEGARENSDYNFYNFFSSFQINNLKVNFGSSEGKSGIPGPTFSPSLFARQKDKKQYLNLIYQKPETKIQFYYNNYFQNYINPDYFEDFNYLTSRAGIDFQQEFKSGLLVGGALNLDDYQRINNFTSTQEIDENVINQAIFFQEDIFWKNLRIISRLRYDYNSIFKGEINPQLSFVYGSKKWWKLSGNISRGYRAPTFNDLFWAEQIYEFPGGKMIFKGNSYLAPESGWSQDLGLEFLLGKKNLLKTTLFNNSIYDQIQWMMSFEGNDIICMPQNISNALNRGIEIEIFSQTTESINQNLNLTYLSSNLSFNPLLSLNHKLNINFLNNFSLIFLTKYVSQYWATPEKISASRVPPYAIVDLYFNKKFKNFDFSLGVENLGNREYFTTPGYPLLGRVGKARISFSY